MENLKIINCANSQSAFEQAGKKLTEILSQTIEPKLLLCSGGSALDILNLVDLTKVSEFLTITVLDERFTDSVYENNFAQLTNTDFYKKALEKNCEFIDTRIGKDQHMEIAASKFLSALRDWKIKYSAGKIFATIGVGADGHTAGILPFPEDSATFDQLFKSDSWVAYYDAKDKSQYHFRITTTYPFFKLIDCALGVALGEQKKSALQKLVSHEGSLAETPALGLWEMKQVEIFTDIKI